MRVRKGDLLEVRFLDHVEDGDEPMTCTVWGRVMAVGRTHLNIVGWEVDADPATKRDNQRTWTILRSTITWARRLTYRDE